MEKRNTSHQCYSCSGQKISFAEEKKLKRFVGMCFSLPLQDGRSQHPLYTREGKEETADLIQAFMKKFPTDSLVENAAGLEKLCNTFWLYGYQPSLTIVAPTPNCMGMMKLLVQGEVKWVLFEVDTLLQALQAVDDKPGHVYTMSTLKSTIADFTVEKLTGLVTVGARVVCGLQQPLQTLYVPPGWICAEAVLRRGLGGTPPQSVDHSVQSREASPESTSLTGL